MTTYPFQLGAQNRLIQRNIFSDVPYLGKDAYDTANTEFVDYAGFDHWRTDNFIGPRLKVSTGTPTFVDVGTKGRRALRLNQTCHLQGLLSNNIHVGFYMLHVPTFGASITNYPIWFGNFGTSTSQGNLQLFSGSGNERLRLRSTNAGTVSATTNADIVSGAVSCSVFAMDQDQKLATSTFDGSTVNNGSVVSDDNHAMELMHNSDQTDGFYFRMGDLDGGGGVVADASNYIDIIEFGVFLNNPINDNLTGIADMITTLKATV
jgi:hypothetical protein